MCSRCGAKFLKEHAPKSTEPKCDTCKHELLKESKRATWERNKTQYRATQRAKATKPADVQTEAPKPEPQFEASPAVGRTLPDGHQIVWMARNLR